MCIRDRHGCHEGEENSGKGAEEGHAGVSFVSNNLTRYAVGRSDVSPPEHLESGMDARVPPAYEREPYRTALETSILEAGDDGGRPYAVLDDTIFYPEGGGQPGDHGLLNGIDVIDVQKTGGKLLHYLASPVAPGPARIQLDWVRRFDHMQQHTGQHLLSAVAQDRFSWQTTAFHLGPEVCDIELDARSLSVADREAREEAVAA